jgi:hypothetical protein
MDVKHRDKASPVLREPTFKELWLVFVLFACLSLLILFFSSIQSPFFRYSFFQDANVYLGIGRAMQHGLMPYRDIFDHKGPLLYLLQYLAAWAFPHSTYGVYILLSLCLTTFLFFGYRIARVFLSVKASFVSVLILQLMVMNNSWWFGLGAAEEYLLPGLMACLYYLVRIFRIIDEENREKSLDTILCFAFSGFWLGTVALIKYTPVPPLALAFIITLVIILFKNGLKTAIMCALTIGLGVLTAAAPVIIYFFPKGIFGDMWAGYIEFNLLYANETNRLPSTHTEMNQMFLLRFIVRMIGALCGLLYLRVRTGKIKRSGTILIAGYIILSFIFVLILNRNYLYYFLPLLPFVCFMCIAPVHFLSSALTKRAPLITSEKISRFFVASFIMLMCVIMVWISFLRPVDGISFSPKSEIEEYADEINSRWSGAGKSEPPRILNFRHVESGLMQLCDSYPMDRYFYMPAIYEAEGDRIIDVQIGYISDGLPDVILLYASGDVTELIYSMNPDYELITLNKADIQDDGIPRINVYMKSEK